MHELYKKGQTPWKWHKKLFSYAKKKKLICFSSPFDETAVDFLEKLNVPAYKIASFENIHLPLIKKVAQTGKPVIISTGLATMEEVDEVVNLCMFESNKKIALLHCVAHYPTDPEEANLLAMDTMRKRFHLPVGYSDNGESLLVDIVAASMGANLIEKHFTIDKKLPGPDHFFSIDPTGLKELISKIRIIERMRSDGVKLPQISEVKNRQDTRKSVTAAQDIAENEIIAAEKLLTKRPAVGIKPKYFERIIGKKANKKIKKDTAIQWEDIF